MDPPCGAGKCAFTTPTLRQYQTIPGESPRASVTLVGTVVHILTQPRKVPASVSTSSILMLNVIPSASVHLVPVASGHFKVTPGGSIFLYPSPAAWCPTTP